MNITRLTQLTIALALGLTMALALTFTMATGVALGAPLAQDQPGGSTIDATQTINGTWGPGIITATSNVVINAGVVITIAPGTTIRVVGNYGFTVNGELRGGGPSTFTAPSATPGAWQGISFQTGSSGSLNQTTVEYAQHALTLNTANPITVVNSTLRYNRHATTAANDDAYGAGLVIMTGDHLIDHTDIYSNVVRASGSSAEAYGGGVDIRAGNSQILYARIYDNSATSTASNGGGAGVVIRAGSAPLIQNSEVTSNTLVTQANLANGGGIGIYGATQAVIRNSVIAANQSVPTGGYGGGGGFGFETGARAALIDANVIANNLSMGPGHSEGGGIDCWDTNVVTVTNNLLYGNRSRSIGGGMNINANTGAGLNVNVFNNTVISNTSTDGGGLYLQSGGMVYNNIVVGNSATTNGGGVYRGSGTADYNDIFGNTAANTFGTMGANNLYVDPLFLGTGDLVQQYHLSTSSPVINKGAKTGTGLPAQDYDGEARPLSCDWDMGFDEVPVGPRTIQCMIDLAAPGDTVIVPAGVYTESLVLSKAVSVTGVSSATVIVRAPASQRVMLITGTLVTNDIVISNMTFSGGNTTASGGGAYITNGAQPRFEDMTIINNTARYRGGALYMDSVGTTLIVKNSQFTGNQANYNNDTNTRGAAIAVFGAGSKLVLENVIASNNTSERYGGAIAIEGNTGFAHLSIADSDISNNTASEVDGGGIFANLAVITITRSTLNNNRAPAGDRMGGAIYLAGNGSALTISGSTLSNNLGLRQGGAIYANGNDIRLKILDDSVLTGNTTTDNDGSAYGGAIYLFGNRAELTIASSAVSTNTSANYGGAIFIDGNSNTDGARLAITDSTISDNQATTAHGGGIWADQTTITATGSTFHNNRAPNAAADTYGGGLYLTGVGSNLNISGSTVSNNTSRLQGAGVYVNNSGSTVIIANSVITANETTRDANNNRGGGLYVYGTGNVVSVSDSTLANNVAEREGGALVMDNASGLSHLTLLNTNITGNEATLYHGGGLWANRTAITMTGGLISNNRAYTSTRDTYGGGLYLVGVGARLTLSDVTVAGNRASASGGGLYVSDATARVSILRSQLSGNTTDRNVTANTGGGGMFLNGNGAELNIVDSTLADNATGRSGGAVFAYGNTSTRVSLINTKINNNQAVNQPGGGLYLYQAATAITETTITNNTASASGADGGGLYLSGAAASVYNSVVGFSLSRKRGRARVGAGWKPRRSSSSANPLRFTLTICRR